MRSWLFVPSDSEAKLAKAAISQADALIVDLEDSVAETAKPRARQTAAKFLRERKDIAPQRWVRINPLNTVHAYPDLEAVVGAGPDGIVLPKPDSAADVAALSDILTSLEKKSGRAVGAIRILSIATETPRAMFALGTYAPAHPRLAALTWGAEDLPAAIGATINRTDDGLFTDVCRLARTLCLLGAAAAGVPAIDGVHSDFRDLTGLRAYAEQGRKEGFTGMLAIHPSQIAVINEVFAVTVAEIDYAKRVVAAFDSKAGTGVVALEGRMLDAPHLKQAIRILSSARLQKLL